MIILAYFIFSNDKFASFVSYLDGFGYLSSFIFGILFSFGFTTPFSVGYFVTSHSHNILLSAVIGSIGATLADLLIFRIIKVSFMDEFKRLEKTEPLRKLTVLAEKDLSVKVRHYLIYIVAGIIISSPLPDELGVSMLAGLSHIRTYRLAVVSFIAKLIGILVILLI